MPPFTAHPRAEMNGDSTHLLSEQLALAGVHAASHRNTERHHLVADPACAADGACRTVERGEPRLASDGIEALPDGPFCVICHAIGHHGERETPTVLGH